MRMFCPFIAVCLVAWKWRIANGEWGSIHSPFAVPYSLLHNARHHAGADGAAALADGEAQLLFHGDRHDQRHFHGDVVARHHHLGALRQRHHAGHVGGAEVELRPVIGEERRVAAAFLLGEDVGLGLELGVRLDRAGLAQHLAALDLLALGAAQQAADVVARLALIKKLAEHLDAGDHGLERRADADDLDFLADLDDAALDAAGAHRAAAGDREHVFDRHQERLVLRALRLRDVFVDSLHQLADRILARSSLLPSSAISAEPLITGILSPGKLYLESSSRTSSSTSSSSSGSSTISTLLRNTTSAGTPTCRASRMCSRVCGIGPSDALTTRIAPSICAA